MDEWMVSTFQEPKWIAVFQFINKSKITNISHSWIGLIHERSGSGKQEKEQTNKITILRFRRNGKQLLPHRSEELEGRSLEG